MLQYSIKPASQKDFCWNEMRQERIEVRIKYPIAIQEVLMSWTESYFEIDFLQDIMLLISGATKLETMLCSQ